MPLLDRYNAKACEDCGELNLHGVSCDNPKCSNYNGSLVRVVLQVIHVGHAGTIRA